MSGREGVKLGSYDTATWSPAHCGWSSPVRNISPCFLGFVINNPNEKLSVTNVRSRTIHRVPQTKPSVPQWNDNCSTAAAEKDVWNRTDKFYGQKTEERIHNCLSLHRGIFDIQQTDVITHITARVVPSHVTFWPSVISSQNSVSFLVLVTKVQSRSYCQQWLLLILRAGLADESIMPSNFPSARPYLRIRIRHCRYIANRYRKIC
jgi:hypothetical protein